MTVSPFAFLPESHLWLTLFVVAEWAIRIVMLIVVPFRRSPITESRYASFRARSRVAVGVKLPRDLSGWKVVSALKRLGFTQTNQEGSHIRLTKGPSK